jgi:hypothetical protein
MKAGMNENVGGTEVRRVLLVGDTTLDPLARLLEHGPESPRLRASTAPYGQIYQILLDGSHPVWASLPDFLVVWTVPQLTMPSLGKLMQFEQATHDEVLREAGHFADAVLQASWAVPSYVRWIQTLTWRQGVGLANLLARANLVLAEKFAAQTNIVLLDSSYWQASLGRPAQDPRMYVVAKVLHSQPLFERRRLR